MRMPGRNGSEPAPPPGQSAATETTTAGTPPTESQIIDLERRRDQLKARVAELQWDLGGLVYEMAIRDHLRMEVLMRRAAALQRVDAELAHVEHLLASDDPGLGGHCASCGAAYARGAAFCSQCAEPVE